MQYYLLDHAKNLSILTPRYFTEFDGYNIFPLSLIFISSGSTTFLGDLIITSLSFSTLRILYPFIKSFPNLFLLIDGISFV